MMSFLVIIRCTNDIYLYFAHLIIATPPIAGSIQLPDDH